MNQYIPSLAEATVASSAESWEHNFMLPILDVLDKVSSSLTADAGLRRESSITLDRVCSTHSILPTRYPRIGSLAVFGDGSTGYGGSADVWRGDIGGCSVAVKVIKRYSAIPVAHTREKFYHEVLVWGRLTHPNILPFLGVDTKIFPLAMISMWMPHGNLREYLARFPSAPRLKLVLEASRGLEYMHRLDYVHGDLKSPNVLIDGNHSARLADFGSSSILPLSEPNMPVFLEPTQDHAFSVRWLAPELIYPEEFGFSACVRSKESDIYALAMLMYEAFSGLLPFQGYRDEGVMLQVISGARPDRPHGSLELGLTDNVWTMMQECWDSSDRRWTISRIVSCLESPIAPTEEILGFLRQKRRDRLLRRLNQLFHTSSIDRAIAR